MRQTPQAHHRNLSILMKCSDFISSIRLSELYFYINLQAYSLKSKYFVNVLLRIIHADGSDGHSIACASCTEQGEIYHSVRNHIMQTASSANVR